MPVRVYRPNWSAYFTLCDSEAAVISLDLGLAAVAPDPERPQVLIISIPFIHPLTSGFPDDPELDRLHAIEDRLDEAVREELNSRFAGKVSISGKRHFFFYIPLEKAFEQVIESVMGEFPDYEFECHAPIDPEWRHYFDILYPKEGDLPAEAADSSLRTTDHWCYFATEDGCRRFIHHLREVALAPVHLEKLQDGKAFPYLLIVSGVHATQGPVLARLEARLQAWVESCGGYYDGWETEEN